MSGFANDIANAIGQLIRRVLQSENYVPGVSGWAIFKDGTVEFNAGTFRSTLQIGSPSGPGLTISPTVPAVLNNYYGTGLGIPLAQAYISIINANGDYFFMVAGVNAGTDVFVGAGVVIGGVVRELFRGESGPALAAPAKFSGAPNGGHVFLGSNSSGAWSALSNNGVVIVGEWLDCWPGTELRYGGAGGVSLSRGPLIFEPITGVFVSDGTANEQTMFTTANSYTFTNGRAYEAELIGRFSCPTVATRTSYNIRKTNLAGTRLVAWPTILPDGTAVDIPVNVRGIFVNSSGANVTAKLAVTLDPTAANVVHFDGAAAPISSYLRVTDIGNTAKFSGVSV